MQIGQSPRLGWVDVAKGLGIAAVVVGHSGAPSRLVAFVYLYHLSLFFFLSGVLFSPRYASDPIALVKRRFRTLFVPFVAYQAGYLVFHNMLFRVHLYETAGLYPVGNLEVPVGYFKALVGIVTLSGIEQMGGAMSFIIALILSTGFFGVAIYLSTIVGRRHSQLALAAMVIAMAIAGYFNLYSHVRPAYVNAALVGTAFYYAGYLYRRFQERVPMTWWTAVGAFAVVYLATVHGFASIGGNHYSSPLFLLLVPITGIYANVALAKILGTNRVLEALGRYSLAIMALHFAAFKAVSALMIAVQQLPVSRLASFPIIAGSRGWWILYTLAGLGLPVAVAVVVARARPRLERVVKPQPA